jgi:nitroreductase
MADILDLMLHRKSYRVPFDRDRPVAADDLAAVLEAARWTPSAHNMQNWEIIAIDDPAVLEAVATAERPVSVAFIRENYEQLSFSEEEFRRRGTGLLAAQFPPAWLAPDIIDGTRGATPDEAVFMPPPLPYCPVMLVVLYDPSRRAPASEGDFLGIISLGCLMQNMWLAAESRGLAMHIVSSLCDAKGMDEILGIPENLVIAFACRIGYPVRDPDSPRVRREAAGFVHRNRYGE